MLRRWIVAAIVAALAPLVDYGWFVGAFGAAVTYLIAHRWFPAQRHIEILKPVA